MDKLRIAIAGAGSIGCFIGGLLRAAGKDVRFLCRSGIADQLRNHGLHLSGYSGLDIELAPSELEIEEQPKFLDTADVVLVCVKSSATKSIAKSIREHAPKGIIVVSLQNGTRNANILRQELPGFDVRAGMVEFNVVQLGKGGFHQGTSGKVVIEHGDPDLAKSLDVRGLDTVSSSDMVSVQWGKLLVNLNNALNALSGLPLVEQLSDRNWRILLANQMTEALKVMKAEGINPKPPSPVPAAFIPKILRLPTPVFKLVARQMLSMDPEARSSMWEDLQKGRITEVDELQGEIVELGKKHNIPTPVNQNILSQIKQVEAGN